MPELEHPVGVLRQKIIDHFLDSEGDRSIAQIIAGLGGTVSRNTMESAVRREYEAGRLLRVSPGVYRLAPEKSTEPSKAASPEPVPGRSDGMTDQDWLDALERWLADSSTWDTEKLGPPPDHADTRVPPPIKLRFADRVRKRIERARDREAPRPSRRKPTPHCAKSC